MSGELGLTLTPTQAHRLFLAALEVAAGPSRNVHKRARATVARGEALGCTNVDTAKVLALVDELEAIRPGIVDRVHDIKERGA